MLVRLLRPASLAALAAAPALWFHLRLVRAEPAVDSALTRRPAALRLWFSQRAEVAVTRVRLTGPTGPVALGPATDSAGALLVPVRGATPNGAYTVEWRTMARDGHAVSGRYGFRLQAAR